MQRYYLHPASEVRFDRVYIPTSRRALDRGLTEALNADRRTTRRYYVETLRRLYPHGRFDGLSDERLVRYVTNEVWYGRLAITERAETGPNQAGAGGVGVLAAAGFTGSVI